MLHIILLILKIIGVFLAVILGLIVLVICAVLFMPVRYELKGKCQGNLSTLRVWGKAVWLFHLFQAEVSIKDQKLKWRVRIAWKKIMGGQAFSGAEEPEPPQELEPSQEAEPPQEPETRQHSGVCSGEGEDQEQKNLTRGGQETEFQEIREQEREKEENEEQKESYMEPEKAETDETLEQIFEEHEESPPFFKEADAAGKTEHEKPGSKAGKERKTEAKRRKSLFERLASLVEKIKCTIEKICAKIKELTEKKNQVVSFIEDEAHITAVRKGKKEFLRLLRFMKPKKCRVDVELGFENPQRTGQVLAVLGILYPFLGEDFYVTPDFEKAVLKGSVDMKGHIRFCHFAATALRLFLCRAVRQSYHDVRKLIKIQEE